jgi:RsiW-degrading membrane proteinase PrsW (M82 family)
MRGGMIWWLDRYEKEPITLLILAFFWGVAPAAILALIFEYWLNIPLAHIFGVETIGFDLFSTGLTGPILEELMKGLGILGLFFFAKSEIDGPLDGIIYGAFVGLGFTATENLLFFLSTSSLSKWTWMVVQRAFLFGLNHAVFAAIIGFGLAMGMYARGRRTSIWWGLGGILLAMIVHVLFNLGLIFSNPLPLSFFASIVDLSVGWLFVAALFLIGLQHDQLAMQTYLSPYVESGLITKRDVDTARSIPRRLVIEWKHILRLQFQEYRRRTVFYNLLAELALKEKQKNKLKDARALDLRISKICGKIRVLQLS